MSRRAPMPPSGRSVRPPDLDEATRRQITDAGDEPGRAAALLRRAGRSTLETLKLIVVALVMAFAIKSLLLQAFYIPSGSMLDTLQLQDRVLVEKVTYRLRAPERGEVIVFRRPGLEESGFSISATATSFLEGLGLVEPDEDRDLIKRVIGLPGELVELRGGVVHINGLPLEESTYTRLETRDFPPVRVPGGHYFVMGDNRGNSLDSRFSLGTVPRDNIIGRAFVILWPPSSFTFQLDQDYPGVGEDPLPVGSGEDRSPVPGVPDGDAPAAGAVPASGLPASEVPAGEVPAGEVPASVPVDEVPPGQVPSGEVPGGGPAPPPAGTADTPAADPAADGGG